MNRRILFLVNTIALLVCADTFASATSYSVPNDPRRFAHKTGYPFEATAYHYPYGAYSSYACTTGCERIFPNNR